MAAAVITATVGIVGVAVVIQAVVAVAVGAALVIVTVVLVVVSVATAAAAVVSGEQKYLNYRQTLGILQVWFQTIAIKIISP